MNEELSSWAIPNETSSNDMTELAPLLSYAHANYSCHTNWFLQHKGTGIKTLATVLTAEFAILGFVYSQKLFWPIAVAGLGFLSAIAIPLMKLAMLSCKKSFSASIENALFVTKIVWASGLAEKVSVQQYKPDDCPAYLDESFYVPRYLNDAIGLESKRGNVKTKPFTEAVLAKKNTSYSATQDLFRLMGASAVFIGVFGIAIIIYTWLTSGWSLR